MSTCGEPHLTYDVFGRRHDAVRCILDLFCPASETDGGPLHASSKVEAIAPP